MNPADFVARAPLRFNCPCSDERARELTARLRRDHATVVDLGCGWGELLLDIIEVSEDSRGVGVERCAAYVLRARGAAVRRGLEGRVSFTEGDAAQWTGRADVVLAVGSSGVFGGAGVLKKLRARMAPGAALLFADATWASEPSVATRALIGELPSAEEVEREAGMEGLAIAHRMTSTLDEWDAFERGWRAPFEQSEDAEARAFAEQRRVQYDEGYRGAMGFAWWVFTAR